MAPDSRTAPGEAPPRRKTNAAGSRDAPRQGQDPEVGQSRGYSGPEPTPEVPVESPAEVGVSGGREASKPPRRPAANHPWRRAPVGRAR